jgi:hypothetical protein
MAVHLFYVPKKKEEILKTKFSKINRWTDSVIRQILAKNKGEYEICNLPIL